MALTPVNVGTIALTTIRAGLGGVEHAGIVHSLSLDAFKRISGLMTHV